MGYIDANGAYVYEETDIADPGAGFSDLLNLGAKHLPGMVKTRVTAELASDPTIRASVDQMVDDLDVTTYEPLGDGSAWEWVIFWEGNREPAIGKRTDGTFYPDSLNPNPADNAIETLTPDQGWRFVVYYEGTREPAFGVRTNGTYFPEVGQGGGGTTPGMTACIVGDSIAGNWTGSAAALGALLGRLVTVEGIGGQQSPAIAARQGAAPARITVQGNAIPASGAVSVTAITEGDGTALTALLKGPSDGTVSRTVVIAGALCTITGVTVGASTTYAVAQVGGTVAMPVPPGTPAVPRERPAGDLTILLGPRNDIGPSVGDGLRQPLDKIRTRYERMLARARRNGGRVIVLPVLPRTDETADGKANRAAVNNMLRDIAPEEYADWLVWLQSDAAFTAAGIAKTTDDQTDIDAGNTPRSMRSDLVHINAAGYKAANAFINHIRTARGL